MFNEQKITKENINKVVDKVYSDPAMTRVLLLDLDPNEGDNASKLYDFRKAEFHRIVRYFISILEYLDRKGDASFEAFSEYVARTADETFCGNYEGHAGRCRSVITDDADFLVDAANAMEHTHADESYIMTRVEALGIFRKPFEKMVLFCKNILI